MTIKILNKDKTYNPHLLDEVLCLQSVLVKTRDSAQGNDGFLISSLEKQELIELLNINSRVYLCYKKNLGFALVTPITEFLNLFRDKNKGSLQLKKEIVHEKLNYIYQVAVSPNHKKMGIATLLLNSIKSSTSNGLLADVLIEPITNSASISFFKKEGFREMGVLLLDSYRTFGHLKSKIYIWERT